MTLYDIKYLIIKMIYKSENTLYYNKLIEIHFYKELYYPLIYFKLSNKSYWVSFGDNQVRNSINSEFHCTIIKIKTLDEKMLKSLLLIEDLKNEFKKINLYINIKKL